MNDITPETHPDINVIYMAPFFCATDNCCICDVEVDVLHTGPNYGIPMYEGVAVPAEWDGEWGGFCACKSCFDKYEAGTLPMWTVEELTWVTRNIPNTDNIL